MKNSFLLIACLAISTISCQVKEYNCTCTVKENGNIVSTPTRMVEGKTKSTAKDRCEALAASTTTSSSQTAVCELK